MSVISTRSRKHHGIPRTCTNSPGSWLGVMVDLRFHTILDKLQLDINLHRYVALLSHKKITKKCRGGNNVVSVTR
jgi:hypothetical protein